jgi:hypothetical protein
MAIDIRHGHTSVDAARIEPTDAPPPQWRRALYELLLSGQSVDGVVEHLSAHGVPAETTRAEADAVMRHPLFALTRSRLTQLRSRDWMLSVYASLATCGDGGSHVAVRHDLPREDFISDFYLRNRAVVLPGAAREWPAVTRWTATYLKERCGEATVEVMFDRDTATTPELNTAKRLARSMRFADYVDLVYSGLRTNNYYIVSRNNFFDDERTRTLLADLAPTPWVRTDLVGDNVNMWFGPAGTLTPLHCDARNNVIVQIVGRKIVRLYAPYYAPMMAQRTMWYAESDPPTLPTNATGPRAVETRLEIGPGDALFIPVGWWHAIEAADVSITLAFVEFGIPNDYGTWTRGLK